MMKLPYLLWKGKHSPIIEVELINGLFRWEQKGDCLPHLTRTSRRTTLGINILSP